MYNSDGDQVDLVFGAHHHSYQRTCPVYKDKCMSAGSDGYAAPVIVDLGMAGYGNRLVSNRLTLHIVIATEQSEHRAESAGDL